MNSFEEIENNSCSAIIYALCNWSTEKRYMNDIRQITEEFQNEKNKFFVLDIDSPQFYDLSKKHGVQSHGKGEVFILKNGKVEAQTDSTQFSPSQFKNFLTKQLDAKGS